MAKIELFDFFLGSLCLIVGMATVARQTSSTNRIEQLKLACNGQGAFWIAPSARAMV